MAAKAIPDTYTGAIPYLTILGAEKAIDFYKQVFGAVEKMRFPGPDGKIMHAELKIGPAQIFVTEENLSYGAKGPHTVGGSPVTVVLYFENVDAVAAKATAAGATFTMPVADMFWGDRSGCLVDPFGHNWMISQHLEDLTPEQLGKRATEAFANPECQ